MIKQFVLLCAAGLFISGCAQTRYQIGWNQGYKKTMRAYRTGKLKYGYGIGFVEGVQFAKAGHDLEESSHRLTRELNKLMGKDGVLATGGSGGGSGALDLFDMDRSTP